ncbi:MAG: type III pantothenate kinase [Saprospiraceae bacterium]|nr:type III pantothenate kinase [Saprospiraceae bacterium]MDW8229217.1 type III pantothenate kinase [Saprospiraceae bacterium]
MNLALDIGNTRIKGGLFRGKQLLGHSDWATQEWALIAAFAKEMQARQVVLSAVAPVDEEVVEQLKRQTDYWLEITHLTPMPFKVAYKTPHTLGRDRIAAVAGAHARFPGHNCLVVDCGTCIKYDMLTAEGVYLGGNIAPGAFMRLRAMHEFTARLPLAPMEMPADFIGDSTTTALQNGALLGATLEIEGFVQTFRRRFADLIVILTGGDATFFRPVLPFDLLVEPQLTLHGLNHLLLFNTATHNQP